MVLCTDIERPRIDQDCPGNSDHDADFRSNGTEVIWNEPTATDNSGLIDNVTITYLHMETDDRGFQIGNNSGLSRSRTYIIGTTMVEYLFTDEAGLSTNCTFNVTITGEFS